MPASSHAVFASLREQAADGPVVVAHRGDSENFAENTLPAFESALRLGVPMQEFDVRGTSDGVLVCIHDESFDRTTDAPDLLGPGALVAETTFAEARQLNASGWRNDVTGAARLPLLAEVLELLAPDCIAMIEHKAGPVDAYLDEVRRQRATARCIVQSFDWSFVAGVRRAAPETAVALLGPSRTAPRIDAAVVEFALSIGAGMLHWRDREVAHEHVSLTHQSGLLLCTYTTDDDLGFFGGRAMGFDAMCTNRPGRMQQLRSSGWLRRTP